MRDDARMTLAEYIKFNSMYGSVKQDRPLSRGLLQSIYFSILNDELLIVDDVWNELSAFIMICILLLIIISYT